MEEIDIWRSAKVLIGKHGDAAEFVAASRADDMIAAGDPAGETVWKRILEAVRELQRLKPKGGEALN